MFIPITNLRAGILFEMEGEVYRVVKYTHASSGRGKATIRISAANLKTGKNREFSFKSGMQVNEVEVEGRPLKFIYYDERKGHLLLLDDQANQKVEASPDLLSDWERQLLRKGVELRGFSEPGAEEIIRLEAPMKLVLKVTETGSGEKGDTASGSVSKAATLETGAVVQVPMFIKIGDLIRVRTETGEYLERAADYDA